MLLLPVIGKIAEVFETGSDKRVTDGPYALSKAIADMIERELGIGEGSSTVEGILGLGLSSDYKWEGEDLIEAFRRRYSVSDRR